MNHLAQSKTQRLERAFSHVVIVFAPDEIHMQRHASVGRKADEKVPARGMKQRYRETRVSHLSISVLSSPIFSRVKGMFTLANGLQARGEARHRC